MSAPVFLDRNSPPTGRQLEDALGPSTALWAQLLHDLSTGHPIWETWRYAGQSQGWRLRLTRQGDTPVLYLSPRRGHFLATFGGAAPGRGVRLDVRSWRDLVDLEERASQEMAR